jgi:hypothetical protein
MNTSCTLKIQLFWVDEKFSIFRQHRQQSKPRLTQATSKPTHNDANFHLGRVIPEIPKIPTRHIIGFVWLTQRPLFTQTVIFIMGRLIVLCGKARNFNYDSYYCHIHTHTHTPPSPRARVHRQAPTITNVSRCGCKDNHKTNLED